MQLFVSNEKSKGKSTNPCGTAALRIWTADKEPFSAHNLVACEGREAEGEGFFFWQLCSWNPKTASNITHYVDPRRIQMLVDAINTHVEDIIGRCFGKLQRVEFFFFKQLNQNRCQGNPWSQWSCNFGITIIVKVLNNLEQCANPGTH